MAGLNLRKEKVGLVLKKRNLINVQARVGFALDASGSMEGQFKGGHVQDAVERMLAIALRLDDDGNMDVWPFDHRTKHVAAPASETSVDGYVDREIPFNEWGFSTAYNPPLRAARDHWFPTPGGRLGGMFGLKRKAGVPALLLLLTDGANNPDDKEPTHATLTQMQRDKLPLYVSFIGMGARHQFTYIEDLTEEFGNVGFMSISDLSLSDDDLYEKLVSEELANWLRASA